MKKTLPKLPLWLILATLILSSVSSGRAGEKEAAHPASIRPEGKVAKAVLPALAKISFGQAMATALVSVPGDIIKAELEIEDGNLLYSFEIVTPAKVIMEVEIDAGNGRVLDVDKD